MSIRTGIIGMSEGNGHPFSFSAIINGYSDDGMASSDWPGIHEYLKQRDPSEFGGLGMTVTHAWTQDHDVTSKLCEATKIPHAVSDPAEMIDQVDAVIVARDDYANHFRMASPFLEAGLPVFVDKPLTLDTDEFRRLWPYIESGQLMSCSGMRFARELDYPRSNIERYGEIRLLRGTILNDWERYGVHVVDAILSITPARPTEVIPLPAIHDSVAIAMSDGSILQIDALGDVNRCFRFDIVGTEHISSHEVTDNFSMFRRMLFHFSESIRTSTPAVNPSDVIASIRLMIAGRDAIENKQRVRIKDIDI